MTEEKEMSLNTIRFLEEEDRINAQAIWLAALDGRTESFSEGCRELLEGYQQGEEPGWIDRMDSYQSEAQEIYRHQQSIENAAEDETWEMAQDLYLLEDSLEYLLEESMYSEAGKLLESFREKYTRK